MAIEFISTGDVSMNMKLNEMAFTIAAAVVSAVVMLALGVLANLGVYTGAAQAMAQWHMFFSLSPVGIVGGMVEAAVVAVVIAYPFAWVYNTVAE
jgi:hypothetical protein